MKEQMKDYPRPQFVRKEWQNLNGEWNFIFDDKDEGDTVKVEDSLSKDQPRGKQRYKKESWKCWYIQTTGIWKTVWIEWVSKKYLKNVKITPKTNTVQLEIETNLSEQDLENQRYYIETEISFNNQTLNTTRETINNNYQKIEINIAQEGIKHNIQKWSTNNPNLYDINYKLYCEDKVIDTVDSYFGIRDITIKGDKIYLNGEQLYLKLILDQGYWKESHLTPPNEESLIKDIESVLAFGYNGIRKHQKIEDERFLYWCDVKGVLVWSEMANCYNFDDNSLQNFTNEWIRVVKQNYNHPSIITWVPINESWGIPEVSVCEKEQNFATTLYYLTKAIDNTRPVISNDGWEHTISDIITIHDYEQDDKIFYQKFADENRSVLKNLKAYNSNKHMLLANGYKYEGQPVIISEYGGIAINSEEGWGYGKQVNDEKGLVERFTKLTKAIKNIPYISGYCYTQLTDVQQEINGLMDADRNYKINPNIIKNINLGEMKKYNGKNRCRIRKRK